MILAILWATATWAADVSLAGCTELATLPSSTEWYAMRPAGDLDGDGIDDLLFEFEFGRGATPGVLLSAHGWRPMELRYRLPEIRRIQVTGGDLNGDQIADLVVARWDPATSMTTELEVYFGPFGPGVFDPTLVPASAQITSTSGAVFDEHEMVAGDFDGDGIDTLAFVAQDHQVWVVNTVLSAGDDLDFPWFTPSPEFLRVGGGGDDSEDLGVVEDFDGDGSEELSWLSIDYYSDNRVIVMTASGGYYSYETSNEHFPNRHPDLDGDGRGDLQAYQDHGVDFIGWLSYDSAVPSFVLLSSLLTGWTSPTGRLYGHLFALQGWQPLVVVDTGDALLAVPPRHATNPFTPVAARHRLLDGQSRQFYRNRDGASVVTPLDIDGDSDDELLVLTESPFLPYLSLCVFAF